MTPERADELMSESYLNELKEEGAGASVHIAGRKAILAACAEDTADLRSEVDRLRGALREFAIVPFRELSDQCVLCGKTWDGDERHAPGCLAAMVGVKE